MDALRREQVVNWQKVVVRGTNTSWTVRGILRDANGKAKMCVVMDRLTEEQAQAVSESDFTAAARLGRSRPAPSAPSPAIAAALQAVAS